MNSVLSDISFVVITLNEEFAIRKCLESLSGIELDNCEIIVVDSGSKDKTLEIIESYVNIFKCHKVFQIKGYANSAIARNIGIRNATKKYIYFIDGDVEIYKNFIAVALGKIASGAAKAITGDLEEIQYDLNYQTVTKRIKSRFLIKDEAVKYYSGGCFLALNDTVKKVGFYDERLERSQDIDFTLRLTKSFRMIAIPESMGIHHTVPYSNKKRMMISLLRCHPAYFGMIVRKNIGHLIGLKALLLRSASGIMFGGLLWLLILFGLIFIEFPMNIFVGACIFLADVFFVYFMGKDVIYYLVVHYLYPLYFILGIFIDFNRTKKYEVIEVI